MDVNNFSDFTANEHTDNLNRLGIKNYSELIGKNAYYSKIVYGLHKVIHWNADTVEYTLEIDGIRFYASPFIIYIQ